MNKYLELFKKNKPLSIIALVVILLVVVGGIFLLTRSSSNNSTAQPTSEVPEATDQPVLKVAPEDLGITLTAGPLNHTVILNVSKTDEITALDYELSYMATVNGSEVSRGALAHIDVKTKGTPAKQSITLGTCSDVCHYDVGVTDVKVTLKINKTDGKIYQADLSLSL